VQVLSEQRVVLTPQMMEQRTYREHPVCPRSKGVHVQAVNRALGVAAGKLDSDDDSEFERFSPDCYPLLPALGVAWEELRASQYSESELIWQPGELERDGIYGTPDGWYLVEDANWECKLTTKKVQPVTGCWMYMKQGLSYCAMGWELNTGPPRRVMFDVCWLLGDYSRPYQPILTTTLVEYEERECESWWQIVRKAAKDVQPE